jgi:hypothetical protein
MWSAIITSAATIGAVLYLQGPIVALGLTAVSSIALLIVLRASEQHALAKPARIAIAPGKDDKADLSFPPLRQVS